MERVPSSWGRGGSPRACRGPRLGLGSRRPVFTCTEPRGGSKECVFGGRGRVSAAWRHRALGWEGTRQREAAGSVARWTPGGPSAGTREGRPRLHVLWPKHETTRNASGTVPTSRQWARRLRAEWGAHGAEGGPAAFAPFLRGSGPWGRNIPRAPLPARAQVCHSHVKAQGPVATRPHAPHSGGLLPPL